MAFFRAAARTDAYRAPLSGDVNQAINPWSWMLNFMGNQFSVLTVNLGRSSDPDLEEQILGTVGSYGSQIGQIGDVLRILIERAPLGDLSEKERKAITALQYQLDKIEELKQRRAAARSDR